MPSQTTSPRSRGRRRPGEGHGHPLGDVTLDAVAAQDWIRSTPPCGWSTCPCSGPGRSRTATGSRFRRAVRLRDLVVQRTVVALGHPLGRGRPGELRGARRRRTPRARRRSGRCPRARAARSVAALAGAPWLSSGAGARPAPARRAWACLQGVLWGVVTASGGGGAARGRPAGGGRVRGSRGEAAVSRPAAASRAAAPRLLVRGITMTLSCTAITPVSRKAGETGTFARRCRGCGGTKGNLSPSCSRSLDHTTSLPDRYVRKMTERAVTQGAFRAGPRPEGIPAGQPRSGLLVRPAARSHQAHQGGGRGRRRRPRRGRGARSSSATTAAARPTSRASRTSRWPSPSTWTAIRAASRATGSRSATWATHGRSSTDGGTASPASLSR